MKKRRLSRLCRLAIVLLTLPVLEVSCVDITQRVVINGAFDAVTPLLDDQFAECLADCAETEGES